MLRKHNLPLPTEEKTSQEKIKKYAIFGALILVLATFITLGVTVLTSRDTIVEQEKEEELVIKEKKPTDPEVIQFEKDLQELSKHLKTAISDDPQLAIPAVDLNIFVED